MVKMMKIWKISVIAGLLMLTLPGCAMLGLTFLQRASAAEDRVHDYAVWVLDARKQDRETKRGIIQDSVKTMELRTLQLTMEGKLDEAHSLRAQTLELLDKYMPSFKEAITNIRGLLAAAKGK